VDQQQLQTARAALWHHSATADRSVRLSTLDAAVQWLEEIGFCLFSPRHPQLPAPAPSFVEACLGAPSVTPPPHAIAQASELLGRLVQDRRVIPLNLLGAFSEQPDFLVTPEMLPWVAAVRGDRQWKTAPGGRTSPIVVRSFEILDQEGELTAIQLREIIGNEITEAAALRALVELWTGLRAMPIASVSEPTRWTLLKNRFAAQLATGANTAQATALSALLSLYLRSAVAATAEEAEIFLSPLTARSRIREMLHGMTATRQIGTTSVASQTLLFVEGSLPEAVPLSVLESPKEQPARLSVPASTPPARKGPRPTQWELPMHERRGQTDQSRPWKKKPAASHRPQSGFDQPRRGAGPSQEAPPASGRGAGQDRGGRGSRPGKIGQKPWERRGKFIGARAARGQKDRPESRTRSDRPKLPGPAMRETGKEREKSRHAPFAKKRTDVGRPPWRGSFSPREGRPSGRSVGPRSGRPSRPPEDRSRARPPFRPERRNQGPDKRPRPSRPAAGVDRPQNSSPPAGVRPGRRGEGPDRRPWRDRPAPRADRPQGSSSVDRPRRDGPPRPFRDGKPFRGGRGVSRAPGQSGPPKNKFRKQSPAGRKPRKNRSQEETPE
jgi:23S rRNA pseudouridine2605 synthase